MSFQGDPYRTLGITPGASLNEIRSAYRRLAKQYHPDAAGERALPRFLAIQAAYERLVDGEGRLRTAGRAGSRGSAADPGSAAGGAEPWRADPARARASRDAWRARRSAGPSSGTGGAGSSKAGTAGSASQEPGSAGSRRGGGGDAGRTERRRGSRKATPGSTTYDEAAEVPRDPEWDGGAWYGPSSGTYWTLNPREYADPRKHGPEYLERARRASRAGAESPGEPWPVDGPAGGPIPAPEPGAETRATGDPGRWQWSAAGRTRTEGGDAEWGTRAWTYDPGAPGGASWSAGTTADRGTRSLRLDAAGEASPLPDLEALARRAAPRNLLALARRPDPRWRVLVALIAWPPIGSALATLLGSLTGCATYSTACSEPMPQLPLVVQPFVIAALVLVPAAAAVGAFASLIALAVAVAVAAVLSVGSGPDARVGAGVLGTLVIAAYLVAVAAGLVALWRPAPGSEARSP
jgi:curved DNA-binding protein CbpA